MPGTYSGATPAAQAGDSGTCADDDAAAGRQVDHRRLHGVGMLATHVGRHFGRKDLVAAVDPGHVERQLAQQPDHIQEVSAFEVAPEQWELRHPPGPKLWYAQQLSERR